MAKRPYADFQPSHRDVPRGKKLGPVPDGATIEFSLYLKPRPMPAALSRAQFAARRLADHSGDLEVVRAFAKDAGLKILSEAPARRLVRLQGDCAAVRAAFKTELHHYEQDGRTFRGRSGMLQLPEDLAAVVESVLGIDDRRAAEPRIVVRPRASAGVSFLPNAVGKLYDFPTDVTGAGECIALIELGGGFLASDTTTAFGAMGLTAPTVVAVPVDGGANTQTPDDGADGEVALDIQVAGGMAPGARIAVYFSVNTDAGFVDAITTATHDATNKPSIMSISWGSAESQWTTQARTSMTSALQDAATLNLSVFVAAGDNLATDGVSDGKAHVDFPASSPFAIGCGGTLIAVSGNKITSETVWNEGTSGTGGGISDVYPVPAFQSAVTLPEGFNGNTGRGVPDVAGNADPESGYEIVVGGASEVVGGTSAVAPLWAGLTALVNQAAGKPAGFFLTSLYQSSGVMVEILTGNNKPSGSDIGYDAGAGWNACTGLGRPDGAKVAGLLAGVKADV